MVETKDKSLRLNKDFGVILDETGQRISYCHCSVTELPVVELCRSSSPSVTTGPPVPGDVGSGDLRSGEWSGRKDSRLIL